MKNLSGYIFLLGIILVILSGLFITLGHQGFVQKILTSAFWVLLIGTIFYIVEMHHGK